MSFIQWILYTIKRTWLEQVHDQDQTAQLKEFQEIYGVIPLYVTRISGIF